MHSPLENLWYISPFDGFPGVLLDVGVMATAVRYVHCAAYSAIAVSQISSSLQSRARVRLTAATWQKRQSYFCQTWEFEIGHNIKVDHHGVHQLRVEMIHHDRVGI